MIRKTSPNDELIVIYDLESFSKQQIDRDLRFEKLFLNDNYVPL